MADSFTWDDLLKTADEAGFTILDPGDYDVKIKTAEAVKSQAGKDMIKVNMEVTTGPNAGKGGIFNNFVLSPENPQAVGFFFRNMGAFGLDRTYFESKPSLAKVATDLVGRPARIKVAHREWQGQTQMDVKSIKPAAPGVAGAAGAAPTPSAPRPSAMPTPTAAPAPAPAPAPAVAVPTPTPAPAPVAEPQDTAPAIAPETERPAPPASPF